MPRLFERITIAGVGLIGGSLGGAVRKLGLAGEVVGFGRRRDNLDIALQRGLIDRYETEAPRAARGADLLLLAVPVQSMRAVATACAPELAPGAIVTDAGSTKLSVVRELEACLPPEIAVVGAHPIAGGEESGAAAADIEVFRGRECIVTPGERATLEATEKVCELWRSVGMRVSRMDPARHDRVLAWVSHLPHAIAFALVRALAAGDPTVAQHGGPSWHELTRIAASSPEMWRDIFRTNAEAIGGAIDEFVAVLQELRATIAVGDEVVLLEWLERARAAKVGGGAASGLTAEGPR